MTHGVMPCSRYAAPNGRALIETFGPSRQLREIVRFTIMHCSSPLREKPAPVPSGTVSGNRIEYEFGLRAGDGQLFRLFTP